MKRIHQKSIKSIIEIKGRRLINSKINKKIKKIIKKIEIKKKKKNKLQNIEINVKIIKGKLQMRKG